MNIVFFVQSEPSWNCFKPVYNSIKNRGIEAIVVAVPHWNNTSHTGEQPGLQNNLAVRKVLDKEGVSYVDINSMPSEQRLETINRINPDCIIVATKDDEHISKVFGISLVGFSKKFKVLYIPYYGGTILEDEEIHTSADGHKHYWGFLIDNDSLLKYYNNNGIKTNLINVGHPKIEQIYKLRNATGEWPIKNNKDHLKILWAPHWTIVEFDTYKHNNLNWKNPTKFGLFLQYCWNFYHYVRDNDTRISVVFRPHPLLQLWLRANGAHHEFRKFYDKWQQLPNTHSELDGLYDNSFASSDLCFTDGISFLVEYPIATGKPLIFLESKVHCKFNELGETARPIWNIANNFEQVKYWLDNPHKLQCGDITPLLDMLLPHRENTSNMIVEQLLNHLKNEGIE